MNYLYFSKTSEDTIKIGYSLAFPIPILGSSIYRFASVVYLPEVLSI